MLQEAIDFLRDNRLIDGKWTIQGERATREFSISYTYVCKAVLEPNFMGGLRLTLWWAAPDRDDDISFERGFNFTDDEIDDITTFIAESTHNIFEHAEALDLRD